MINLLPLETRDNILYARRNTKMMHWAIAMGIGIVGIIVVAVFGHFYIDQNTKNISRQAEQAQAELKELKLEETQARVEGISSSLKLVTQVLSKQVLLSDLIQQIGAVMPSGAALANLSVNKIEGGIDLTIMSKDYQTASQVQVNLQDPSNKIFDKVDIININCNGTPGAGGYTCTGTYRASFAKENPFLFLKNTTTGAAQ